MTGRDLIAASLRLIGAYASGETPSADESTDGLNALNRMIDGWSTQSLLIYTIPRETFSFTASKGSYTMGSGGDFNTARPLKIKNAVLVIPTTTPNIERPIEIVNRDEYAAIIQKAYSSQIPLFMYPEGSYPLETLNFWPVPSDSSYSVGLYSWKQLSTVATLDTSLSFPPGYERALVYNLAVEIAPEYGKAPPEIVLATAEESKGDIKRLNADVHHLLRVDPALQSRPSRFNIYTGEFR